MVRLEATSMEYRMHLEPYGKLQLVGYISYPSNDREWTFILANQSFMHFAKEPKLSWLEPDQHHVALLEVQRSPSPISPLLHLLSSLLKVCPCNLCIAMPLLGQMICRWAISCIPHNHCMRSGGLLTSDDFEGALARCRAPLQVVRELGYIEQLHPILLVGTHKVPQVLLKKSIYSFSLAISLGVKASEKV